MYMPAMSRPAAVSLLLLSTAIWGFAFVAQKSAMDHMGPMTFAGVRFLIGAVALLPFALLEAGRKRPALAALTRRQWLLFAVLSVAFFFASTAQQYGLIYTSVTNSGFLTALYVLFTPLVAFIAIRAKPHPIIYVGAPLALVGIFYLNGGHLSALNFGDALVVLSAAFWGVQVFLIGHLTGRPACRS